MSRLPFDAGRAAGASKPEPNTGQARPLSVGQLAAIIDHAVRDHVPTGLRVIGEIGQFRARTHWYFDLKDAEAVIACVMWQSAARKAVFTPASGQQVLVTGRVEFYPPQGRTQFMVDRIEPIGDGALEQALRALVDELRGLGWLDEARKRPVKALPARVAVVTSAGGAALQDVRDTVARRCPSVQLCLVDVRVQGAGAAAEITRAIRRLSAMHAQLGIDTIILTRGGGSKEDLWAFNDRELARAIVESAVPVVAAIGHETDVTVAELVADARAATPTQAAMRAVPEAAALHEQIRALVRRMNVAVLQRLASDGRRVAGAERHVRVLLRDAMTRRAHALERLTARLESHRPATVYAERAARLEIAGDRLRRAMSVRVADGRAEDLEERLSDAVVRALHDRRISVEAAARNLDLVGPPGVMRRGYSVTLDASGRAIRAMSEVPVPGSLVRTRILDGAFSSVVASELSVERLEQESTMLNVAPAGTRRVAKPDPRPVRRGRGRPDRSDGTPGLFDAR